MQFVAFLLVQIYNLHCALHIVYCALCNFAIYCIGMAVCGMLVNLAKDPPRHLNSIWTLLSLTPRLSSTPPILTINIIKDMTVMIKDIMVVIRT